MTQWNTVTTLILAAALVTLPQGCAENRGIRRSITSDSGEDVVMYHLDSGRQGWKSNETTLNPTNVVPATFHKQWENMEPFDSIQVKDPQGVPTTYAPHVFASPLFLQNLTVATGAFSGSTFSVVFAATTNGVVYALNATTKMVGPKMTDVPPGTLLWKTTPPQTGIAGQPDKPGALGMPLSIPGLDGNLPLGVLSTPVIDNTVSPPTMYVTAVDAKVGWQVFALDLSTGHVLPNWPVAITQASIAKPGILVAGETAAFLGSTVMSQRGALALGQNGSQLYVPFGAYNDGGTGFMVVIDTQHPQIASAFSAETTTAMQDGKSFASGGMWAAGGPAVDSDGFLYATTGNSPVDSHNSPGTWGQSLLRWSTAGGKIKMVGIYTPFNYCQMDVGDIDLAGSAPIAIDLDPAKTSTPHLMAFGGKQGNVYLVDRENLSPNLGQRHPCVPADFNNEAFTATPSNPDMLHPDPTTTVANTSTKVEISLVGPTPRDYYASPGSKPPRGPEPGPLNVFGPYQETFNNGDFAKMRTVPAFFQDVSGQSYLYISGTTRDMDATKTNVIPAEIAPGLVRLKIVTPAAGKPAFLDIDTSVADKAVAMKSAGSPVVTSQGPNNAIVWVLDANVRRGDPLIAPAKGPAVPNAILYAYDASTLRVIWKSTMNPGDSLHVGGKYNTPAIAIGQVFVGTDRIQAFGLSAP